MKYRPKSGLIMPSLITLIVTAGFFALTAYFIKYPIPTDNKDILLILIGSIAAKFGDVVAYWIGSSLGSHNKDRNTSNDNR
jgi:membrane protein DedA with SNARE-associated domain